MARVAVVIPAYNSEETIVRALESARAQTLVDIEILVVDDCSSDGTLELVVRYAARDARIRVLKQPVNRGPAAARNLAIAVCTSEWITPLDADDYIQPDRLERMFERARPQDVLVADNLAMFDVHAKKVSKLAIDKDLLLQDLELDAKGFVARCQTNQPDAVDFGLLKPLVRVSHLLEHEVRYQESIRYGEDFRFYLDMLMAGGTFRVFPEAYYWYTERTGSLSGKRSDFSKTQAKYDGLAADTRVLIEQPAYNAVVPELLARVGAIEVLAKVSRWGQQSKAQKISGLAVTLLDHDMRRYLMGRARAKRRMLLKPGMLKSGLFQDASNLCLGQGIKLVLQAIYFLFIARSLGPAQYGSFVAVTAMTGILSPYVGLGAGSLFLKNFRAGKRTASLCWGNGLVTTLVTGLATMAALCLLAKLWLGNFPLILLGLICASDLLSVRVIDLASFGFAASGHMRKTAVQNTTMSLLRVVGIVGLTAVHRQVSVAEWTWVYVATGILGAGFAFQQGTALWGTPSFSWRALIEDAREGCFFSISTSAQTIYNDIDKTMLARLSTFSATGVYAAAYRIIDTSLTPVRSLVSAAYPEFFRIGQDGVSATYEYAKSLIRRAMIFGVADCVALVAIAPLLPHILGPQYAAVAPAIRLLALIPLLRCAHWFLADALSGADAQGLRTAVQVGVAALNIGLNVVILPKYSWVGAGWTSLASDLALLVGVYASIQVKKSRISARRLNHVFE